MKKNTRLNLTVVIFLGAFILSVPQAMAAIAQRGSATSNISTSTSIVISKPTGVVAGDVLVVDIAKEGNNTTNPSSSGWTLIDGRSLGGQTSRYGAALYKVASSSEPATYTFTLGSGTNNAAGAIIAFSGVNISGATPFDVAPGTILVSSNSGTNVGATTMTTVSNNAAVIMLGMLAGSSRSWDNGNWNTAISPGALTELFDVAQGNSSDGASVGAAWAMKPTAGTTGAGSATLSGGERNGAILIALKLGKITPTISVTNSPATYSGSTQAAIVIGSVPGVVSNIKYNSSSTTPTNAGSYTITANFVPTDTTNYNTLTNTSTTGNFVINKADQTITFGALPNKTYGAADFGVNASTTSGLSVSFSSLTLSTCTVSGLTVHIVSAGGCTIRAAQIGNGNYNAALNIDQSFTINEKVNPTLSITNSPTTYNGSTQAAIVIGSVPGSASNIKYNSSSTTPTNAGAYAVIADFTPTDTANYNSVTSTTAGDFVINKANATISVTPYFVTYDAASHTAAGTATGVSGADLNASLNLSGTAHADAGSYSTDAWTFTGGINYNDSSGTVADNIDMATATIVVSGYTGIYDGSSHGATGTAIGVGGADLSGLLDLGASFKNVSGGTADWTFAGGTNYNNANSSVAIVISPRTLNITATGINKVYDGGLSAVVILSDDRVAGDIFTDTYSATSTEFATSTVGTGIPISVGGIAISGADAGNYTLSTTTASTIGNITQYLGSIALDIANLIRTYNGLPQEVAVTSTTPDGLPYAVTYNGSGTPPVNAWAYTVLAALTDSNYSATSSADLVINKADQTISFDALSDKNFGDPDFPVSATSSSGLSVTFATGGSCSVDGDTVHLTSTSTCTITASQAGDDNYNPASPVLQSFSVVDNTPPVITLSGDNPMNILVGSIYAEPGATSTDDVDGNLPVTIGGDTVTTTVVAVFHVTYSSVDSSGNGATTTRTVNVNDTPAPVLSGETSANPVTDSITITWTTDHEATSRVLYGTVSHNPVTDPAPNYGYANSTVEDSATTTSHSVTVTGLTAGTNYFFRPVSHGSPEAVGAEIAATTASAPSGGGGGGSGGGANFGGGSVVWQPLPPPSATEGVNQPVSNNAANTFATPVANTPTAQNEGQVLGASNIANNNKPSEKNSGVGALAVNTANNATLPVEVPIPAPVAAVGPSIFLASVSNVFTLGSGNNLVAVIFLSLILFFVAYLVDRKRNKSRNIS